MNYKYNLNSKKFEKIKKLDLSYNNLNNKVVSNILLLSLLSYIEYVNLFNNSLMFELCFPFRCRKFIEYGP
jgi:hypothetical protein